MSQTCVAGAAAVVGIVGTAAAVVAVAVAVAVAVDR